MNQEFNENKTNRFIFSDDFYDRLASNNKNTPPENNDMFESTIMPSYEQIEDKQTPIIDNSEVNNVNEILDDTMSIDIPEINNNEIQQQEETKSVTETLNEEGPIVEEPINTINEVNEPDIEQVQTVATIQSEENNDFDAISQINKELEQEIMKLNVENQSKSQFVEQGKWFDSPKEIPVYRAARNSSSTIQNISINDIEPVESINTDINPQLAEINKLFKQPEVINIDELIKQDADKHKEFNYIKEFEEDRKLPVIKSDLIKKLRKKEIETGKVSILARYGEDFCEKDYITNPAIGRDEEIKQLILILLTPEKSSILVGKPGIGKTAIVEGLAYRLQRSKVPDALKGYRIVSVKTTSLLGTLPTGETRLQTLIDELKDLDKIILFIDEVHMLMGATKESSLDFANMFKESLGRGSIKMIGATTSDEYERYVLRDKAFARRFQRVDIEEPSREHTIEILMGSLPKLETNTGVKLKYSDYIKSEIMAFIVDITTEYKRVYGIGSRYPDICLTLLSQAFSQAVFDNRKEVNIFDIRNAIENSKNIYPDVIRKELVNFDKKFVKIIEEENK